MSVNEKTGLPDFDGDVHNNEIYWDEEPDPENDIPSNTYIGFMLRATGFRSFRQCEPCFLL